MQQTVNGVHSEEWYSVGVICFIIFCLFSFCHCFIFFVMRFKIKKIQTCVCKCRFLLSLLFSFPPCFFFTRLEMFNSVLLYCWNFLCQGIEIRSSGIVIIVSMCINENLEKVSHNLFLLNVTLLPN